MNENIEIIKFCRSFLRGVSEFPIRPSEFTVLAIMCSSPGPYTPAGLAEKLGVSKPMVSAHLSSLMAAGFVLRVPSPEDGRSVYVIPSKNGAELFKRVNEKKLDKINVLISGLGQKNFDKFVQLIMSANRILDN